MANVLAMPARELRHPVALTVLVIAADRPLHNVSVPSWSDLAFGQTWVQKPAVRQQRVSGNQPLWQRCMSSRWCFVECALRAVRYDRRRPRPGARRGYAS